jgi:putative lipoprotein
LKREAYYRTEYQFVNICRGEAGFLMVVTDNDGLRREVIPIERQMPSSNGLRLTGTSDRNIRYTIDNTTLTILFPGQKPYQEKVIKASLPQFATKPVSQPPQTATVTGTVTYRQRIALPPNAVVKVRLQDVSRADAPAILLDEQTIPTNGKQVPFPFTLNYNPSQIKPNHSYAVSAQIFIDGKLRWTSTTRNAVITNGNPTNNVTVMVNQVRAGN